MTITLRFFAHNEKLRNAIKPVNEDGKIRQKQGRVVSVNTLI
jgi:hypothetical protein